MLVNIWSNNYFLMRRFSYYSGGYDIALLKVENPFPFSTTVRSICLPNNISTYHVAPGTYCIATGWGNLGKLCEIFSSSQMHFIKCFRKFKHDNPQFRLIYSGIQAYVRKEQGLIRLQKLEVTTTLTMKEFKIIPRYFVLKVDVLYGNLQ